MPVATVNGVNLNYQVDGEGPPPVLMHGFSTGLFVWEPVIGRLARNFQVFRYDHRGHGDSGKPPGPWKIQDFSDDLEALLNYLGLERVDLAGHSMGGRTALLFALQHGERLNRLILVGASGSAPEGDPRGRFEALKELTRIHGVIDRKTIDAFIGSLNVSAQVKAKLKKLTPENYIGMIKF